MLGLYHILQESITTQFPNILFENCSGSGGGRFDVLVWDFLCHKLGV